MTAEEGKKIGELNIIFCSDVYILDINRKFLNHDYFTDVITFDYCRNGTISGDVYISTDTVKENSGFYGTDFEEELLRTIFHGVLHLCGYNDDNDENTLSMRERENLYLHKIEND